MIDMFQDAKKLPQLNGRATQNAVPSSNGVPLPGVPPTPSRAPKPGFVCRQKQTYAA